MKVIHKYVIKIQETFSLDMPAQAQILSVQMQGGLPKIWAIVDDENVNTRRNFYVVGTGIPLASNPMKFIGTFQDGVYVWHLFELTKS